MQRGYRGLHSVRAGWSSGERGDHQCAALLDHRAVPSGAVLRVEQHHGAGWIGARVSAGVDEQHQREQPAHLPFRRHQAVQDAREADCLLGEVGALQMFAAARGVALGEDRVQRREHHRQALRQFVRSGHRNGMRAPRIFFLARTIRWAIVGDGTRKARATSFVVRPPRQRRISATRSSAARAGWAHVKNSSRRSSGSSPASGGSYDARRSVSTASSASRVAYNAVGGAPGPALGACRGE
ncbi:hypothetical protein NJ76_19475, partial [Rhodococcus sp. IITR03]